MFEDIIAKLGAGESPSSEKNDKNFARLTASTLNAGFVDGGNASVFESPGARIEYVRIYGTVYKGKERRSTRKEEGLLLLKNDGKGRITIKGFGPLKLELSIPEKHAELSFGRESASLATVANLARFILECRFLHKLGEECDCDLLVRDGSLVAKNSYEEEELKKLLNNQKLVAGLSKTSSLLTKGGFSTTAYLLEEGPDEPWLADHGKEDGVCVGIVKLHARSEYAFRLDASEELEKAAGSLVLVSSDPAFPGYPYPLIEADRVARVTNKELAMLKTRFMAEAGRSWKRLKRMAHGIDAHGVLDRM